MVRDMLDRGQGRAEGQQRTDEVRYPGGFPPGVLGLQSDDAGPRQIASSASARRRRSNSTSAPTMHKMQREGSQERHTLVRVRWPLKLGQNCI